MSSGAITRLSVIGAVCIALGSAGAVQAQGGGADQTAPTPTVRPVVVPPPPPEPVLRKQAHDFAEALTPGPGDESLMRWNEPVCPLVAGLPRRQAEAVLARVSQDVRAVGAPLGPSRCRANLYIVVTPEPDRLLALWRRHDLHLFGDGLPAAIRRFATSTAPVRVWYDTRLQSADGPARSVYQSASTTAVQNAFSGAPAVSTTIASHLQRPAVRAFYAVIVLADAGRVNGATTDQLADYVAMAALARVDPDAKLGPAPTILKLFDGAPADAPDGLTDWDRAFLRGLYKTDQASVLQRSQIVRTVVEGATQPSAPPAAPPPP